MPKRASHNHAELILGRYRLTKQLGVGASAAVWQARDERGGREVALKLLHPHLAVDRTARLRLRAEARSARRLRSPAAVRLLAEHLDAEQPALAFEFAPGETLAQRLARDGALEPGTAAHIAAAVADGLADAHRQGVVHRDVKPSNVLLADDGRVLLLDFGISGAAGMSALTDAGTTVGTLPYMSPEQLAGQPPDPASDVYALGALLYEMLSGHVPYPATNQLALAEQQLAPPPPLNGPAHPMADVAQAALSHDPLIRPTAAEAARRLRALAVPPAERETEAMTAAHVLADPAAASPHGGVRGWRRSRPTLAGAALGATLALGITVAALSVPLDLGRLLGATGSAQFDAMDFPALIAPTEADMLLEPSPSPAPGDNDGTGRDGGGRRGGGGGDDDKDDKGKGKGRGRGGD